MNSISSILCVRRLKRSRSRKKVLNIENKSIIDMNMTGKRINQIAEIKGYNVKELQKYLGLSCPQPIYRWYKGLILPSVDNLLKLSDLFGVHMEELLVKNDEPCFGIKMMFCKVESQYFIKRMQGYCERYVS